MWIIAGPNGAGKSGFAEGFLIDIGYHNFPLSIRDSQSIPVETAIFSDPVAPRTAVNQQRETPWSS